MADLASHVEKLTKDHLTIVIQTFAKSPPSGADETFLTYGLATEVLRFFLGNEWTNENVFSVHPHVSPPNRTGRQFLKTDSTEAEEQFRHMQRVTTLAEILFNLQDTEGLKHRISIMHHHDLEAALGEMECAGLLGAPALQFRFVTPSGVKGEDYEGEIVTSANRIVACEMKSRTDQRSPTKQTVWNTLEHARKQVPKGKPAIVLLKIPEVWLEEWGIKNAIEAAIDKLFRQSHRIVAIVFTWEEWYSTSQGAKLVVSRIRPYPNKRSGFYEEDIDALLAVIGRAGNPAWVHFHRLVNEIRDAA